MQTIRVAQIVDNLTPGGTESVAVNLANGLSEETGFISFLICTRTEGEFKERLLPAVNYFFLNKQRKIDTGALWRLFKFVRKHKINIVHAHSTTFYFPVLIKWMLRFKLVWHDHYGREIREDGKRLYPYIPFSRFFNYVISVNDKLLISNKKHLYLKPSLQSYLPNYSVTIPVGELPELKGVKELRLICLANLRHQKDHFTLLKAFQQIREKFPAAVLYCVGICEGDAYEASVREFVKKLALDESVVFTDSVVNPFVYLRQSVIGILSSLSEGLPLSLIEYGLAGLPVVCTNVGQCAELLQNGKNGLLVLPQNADALATGCIQLLEDKGMQKQLAVSFNGFIKNNYSKEAILHRLISIYKSLN